MGTHLNNSHREGKTELAGDIGGKVLVATKVLG